MQVDATVFTCISMLARAMGPSIQQDIKELLEPMLAVGLRWDKSILLLAAGWHCQPYRVRPLKFSD